MLEIEFLRNIIKNESNVFITQHSLKRFRERGIKYNDIISCINNGEIIEQYPNDFPNPSCLILGKNCSDGYIHVVCGTDGEYLWIITAYYPTEAKWQNDLRTRKD